MGNTYRFVVLLAALAWPLPSSAVESHWVRTGATGRLIYVPDAEGDRILDFSGVGYRGRGTQQIPDHVPNVVVVSPVAGDDTATIQAAIDTVGAMPIGPDGFRGAVLLEAGEYDIADQLTIHSSGIVLRGVGRSPAGTVLHARGTTQRPLVQVLGAGSPSFTGNPKRNMIDKTVPVGSRSFRVDSTAGLSVGDTVRVERPSTAAWIEAVGMHEPFDGDPAWVPNTMNVRYDRVITRIEGNRIFLDAPLATAFEQRYGGGTIQAYSWSGRIENIGIENLRAESDYAFDTDEQHAWEFVSISNAQNVWVRHTTSQFFGDSAVVSNPTSKWVTVDDAINLDPKSLVAGERRYTFDLSGQLGLVTGSQANSGRHDFVNNSTRPPGPNVFHNSVANNALNDSGPHQRWATGTLFDNIRVNGNNINARNRESLGTRHGWSGANMIIWNSTADGFIVQNPPTAQNWLIGSTGPVIDDTTYGPQPPAYIDSHGTPVTAGGTTSLYEAQMNDAADIREFHWGAQDDDWHSALAWRQAIAPGIYRVSSRDYLVGDIDGFEFDGAGSDDAVYIDPDWRSYIESTSKLPITTFDNLDGDQNVAFTIEHLLDSGERVVHGYLALALRASSSDFATDFIRLFDGNPANRIGVDSLKWDDALSTEETFVGVLDLGTSLDQLQQGRINVQLNDDVGVDWALYVATVAAPVADSQGPSVFLDGGGVTRLEVPVSSIRTLQIGGADNGTLSIDSAGEIGITENYTQLDNGTLAINLNVASPSEPIVSVQGSAELNGALRIALADSILPEGGQEFDLISAVAGIGGQFDTVSVDGLPTGIAWQIAYEPTSVRLQLIGSTQAGDYNGDGQVDAADYVVWRKMRGETGQGLAADGDGDGSVNDADYTFWRERFMQQVPAPQQSALGVPEPHVLFLGLATLLASGACRFRSGFHRTYRNESSSLV